MLMPHTLGVFIVALIALYALAKAVEANVTGEDWQDGEDWYDEEDANEEDEDAND